MQSSALHAEIPLTERGSKQQKSRQENRRRRQDQGRRHRAWAPLLAAAAVILAVAVGIGSYNAPEKRLQRYLDLGNKYLLEQQYETAIVEFEKAIAIDERCIEAYTGGLAAYMGAGDQAGAQAFYEKTLVVLDSLEPEFTAENLEGVVSLYLSAAEVYPGDGQKAADILAKGYEQAGADGRIQEKQVETYLSMGKEKTRNGAWIDALEIYDQLLGLAPGNQRVVDDLCACLNQYIAKLMKEKDYAGIRALAEKYRNIATKVDFEQRLEGLEELEEIAEEHRVFLEKVYDLMAAADYEALYVLHGSEEADAFAGQMDGDREIYFPDGVTGKTGVGAGVYRLKNNGGAAGYYFYYGSFADGTRKGNGTGFVETDARAYQLFVGTWERDMPNGAGTLSYLGAQSDTGNGWGYSAVSNGRLVNGLWTGDVTKRLTDHFNNGEVFDLSFAAVNGIPTEDKTAAMTSAVGRQEISGYVYAYDYHQGTDTWWWSTAEKGETVGVLGFADVND